MFGGAVENCQRMSSLCTSFTLKNCSLTVRCQTLLFTRPFCRYKRSESCLSGRRPVFKLCNQLPRFPCQSLRFFGQPAAQTHPHLLQEGEVTPGISKSEFQLRRLGFMRSVLKAGHGGRNIKDHIALFPSATKSYMTHDIPYPFRQNTDFLYLCGFQEPDSLLILENKPGKFSDEVKSVLFVPKRDPAKELWDGPRSGIDGALDITAVDESYNCEELVRYLEAYCSSHSNYGIWYEYIRPAHQEFHAQVLSEFLKQDKQRFMENTRTVVQQLRLIKTEAEISRMKQTCDTAAESFIEVIKSSYPGINESHLYAKMEYECRIRNAEFLAYPPVVAGGDRANIIHYISNNQIVQAGEMVLMDAGCEFHGYTSDITRTWPISSNFSPAQRVLYEAVLSVQEACIQLCTSQVTLDEIFSSMLKMLGHQLKEIGVISRNSSKEMQMKAARKFCPHHVGHYLGMDVHDTADMSRHLKLQPGMVITVEPGLYVPLSDSSVPEKFRGIGIRIEDDVLITSDSPVVLTSKCPKHPDQIQALMAY